MPWCPECKIEYRDGIDKCNECGHVIVEKIEIENPEPDYKNMKEAFLITADNSINADIIEAILKDNNIPVLRKYREAGGYMMVFMGGTIYGVDLYVPQQLLDKAKEVIDTSRNASKDEQFPDNIEPEDEDE
jgi:hypothetical protein